MRMIHGDEELPKGIIHHSKRHPKNIRKVAVECLLCGRERYVIIPRGKQREKEGFTGACHPCGKGKRTKEEKHPSGAIILWGKRVKGKRNEVPFICLNCGKEKIVWATQIYSKVKPWRGWCGDCIEARGSHRKFIKDEELKPWDSWIFFSQRTATHIPVKCGLCGRTRMMAEGSVLANWQRRMTGYCANRFECNKARRAWAEKDEQPENTSVSFSDFSRLADEIKPRIKEAQKLASRTLYEDLDRVVGEAYPELVPAVIRMLPNDKPSECAREQAARQYYGCSYSTLMRKRGQQNT